MKPINIISIPPELWALRDERGEFYAYSTPDGGVRCTNRVDFARKYSTRKGASTAMVNISQSYGKQTKPILLKLTYQTYDHETANLPI